MRIQLALRVVLLLSSTALSFAAPGQTLVINELMTSNSYYYSGDGNAYPWIEFVNHSDDEIDLADYTITHDPTFEIKYSLPSIRVPREGIVVIWFSGLPYEGHADAIIDPQRSVLMLLNEQNTVLDKIDLTQMEMDHSYGRRPGFIDEWIYFQEEASVTPGLPNIDPGPWVKIKSHAEFPIGDAGYGGTVVYQNAMWILGYETMDENAVWQPLRVVYKSTDGWSWTLVNANAPYQHGAMFAVFQDYIWAFDGKAYRSNDGVTWELMSTNTPAAERIAVFNDALWILRNNTLYKSDDGVTWTTVTTSLPWEYREWPGFLAHNDKLWMFGGNKNYYTGNDTYFTDVWSSENGVDWVKVNEAAPWKGSFWFNYISWDNRLWMINGGWNYFDKFDNYNGNKNEIWSSNDGVTWREHHFPSIWFQRHAAMTWVFKNQIWLAAGYAGGGRHHLFNDVWKYSRRRPRVNADFVLTYGDDRTVTTMQGNGSVLEYSVEDPEIATVVDGQLTSVNAGSTKVTVSVQNSDLDEPTQVTGRVVVHKKDLVVTPDSVTTDFGTHYYDIPLRYDGFVRGEDESVLTEKPFVPRLDLVTPIGKYQVRAEGGMARNYHFIYSPGVLEIKSSAMKVVYAPNPVTSTMALAYEDELTGRVDIDVYDMTGRTLVHREYSQFQHDEIDLSLLSPGIYILSLKSIGVREIHRIVKR